MNIGYHSNFMDRIIERTDKRQERMEKMINKMLDKSEPILNAGKPKPLTNEEYIRNCSTEELAKFLQSVNKYCDYMHNCKKCPTKCKNGGWIGWLKEIHHG